MNLTAWMASINGVIAANAPHPWVIGALWGLCVIDGFFPPVPSESLVVALAAIGHPSRWLIIPVAAAGAICGDNIAYWVGRQIGHTKLFTGGPKRQKTVAWATHQLRVRGPLCILVARYIPGGRVVVNAMAGATRFSYRVFLSYRRPSRSIVGLLCHRYWCWGSQFLGQQSHSCCHRGDYWSDYHRRHPRSNIAAINASAAE